MHKISKWIKKYAKKNNIKSLVVGVSGGIDSAVVSALCCQTGITTYVLSMPIHQNRDQLSRARSHSEWLCQNYKNTEFIEIDLTTVFENFASLFSPSFKNELSLANTRSRLRMVTLYQIAGSLNGIVVGTGNKVEDFGIGFFTKYGDGGVDISPIADLTKTEVRELAKDLEISRSIIDAKPTDGLWEDDRSDEDQIGASYTELEWAMEFKGDINLVTTREKEVIEIYKKLNISNSHKMRKIPIFKTKKNKNENIK